jgi:hypothetical protein
MTGAGSDGGRGCRRDSPRVDAGSQPFVDALADLEDTKLSALAEATNSAPQIAPGLLAWIDTVCDWELNRRAGLDYEMLPPEAAIDSSADELSVDSAIAMGARFAQDSPAVGAPRSGRWRSSIYRVVRSCAIECRLTGGVTGSCGSGPVVGERQLSSRES